MKRYAVIVPAVVLFITAACGYSVTPSNDGPDRVASVVLKCEVRVVVGSGNFQYREETGAACDVPAKTLVRNRRQVVTMKTAQGTTYSVDVEENVNVKVGQAWPPK